MTRYLCAWCVVVVVGAAAAAAPENAATLYVAPAGNDAWTGRLSAPNNTQTDGPLATLEAARDAARRTGARRIVLLPGDYFLAKTLELDRRDNGLTIEASEAGKVVLYGGTRVTGWRPDGDRFWCADLPGVKEGTWDFRALVVNNRLAERARLPETGTFLHQSVFDARWLSSVGGGWERPPTKEELTTLRYDPKDLPPTLEVKNAEVRVYHMWNESMVGLAANDTQRNLLIFSTPAQNPPGAFG
ncbi:MAG: hypothetical protein QHJ73_11615, partial [Armatimonadota bacterium]|nr:hypothetical protein [Armatimonadota bacterium]